jgi:hypothetical protein
MRQRGSNRGDLIFVRSLAGSLAPSWQWEQTYLVSAPKKPHDSVALYPHRIRVDHSSVRKLQEVIDIVKQQQAQRTTEHEHDID